MFEVIWVEAIDYVDIINQARDSVSATNACDNLLSKMNECWAGLLNWSKQKYGNCCKKGDELRTKIAQLQQGVLTHLAEVDIGSLTNQLEDILDHKNLMCKQRSKFNGTVREI